MSVRGTLKRILFLYGRLCGGIPHARVWQRYVTSFVSPHSVVTDVGGGDGELANYLAPSAKWVFILDKEETSMDGADNIQYAGSLSRALRNRKYQNITPVKGDAASLPFSDDSLDAVIACELIEHLDAKGKRFFFHECRRVLKENGLLIMSAPNAEYMEKHRFLFSRISRRLIPKKWIPKLPVLLRGPWLIQTVEGWEIAAGHYERGCRLNNLRAESAEAGFSELDHRYLHTGLTSFWLQLMLTFPLFYLCSLPLVKAFYSIEAHRNGKDGVSILLTLRKSMSQPPAGNATFSVSS